MISESTPVKRKSILTHSPSTTTAKETSNSIRVICRFRPPKETEVKIHGQSETVDIYEIDDIRGTVAAEIDFEKKNFTFDKVYDIGACQSDIFSSVVGIIDSVMEGFNGTILAYGQTSSGKTHTMEGPSLWNTSSQGVIPRTVDKLFQAISEADVHTEFTVSVSYFEVYCEKIRDLLNPSQDNLKMRELKQEGFVIQDITEVFCVDRESILQTMEMGKTHRASAPTLMNAESSRSHSILSLVLTQKSETTGRHRKGKLFLVDLAGSEKVSKTGAKGARLEEAKKINMSLTTLGMVINALCDGSAHIPYRDSKLTRILQDSLGGNSKTTLIICCAPEARHSSETLSTLRFGERAKRIKNNAKVNEELGVPELKKLLAIAQREIAALKAQFEGDSSSLPSIADITPSLESESDLLLPNSSSLLTIDVMSQEEKFDEDCASVSDEVNGDRIRIQELEELLDQERSNNESTSQQYLVLQAEHEALKRTVEELECKILESNLSSKNLQIQPSHTELTRTDSKADFHLCDLFKENSLQEATTTMLESGSLEMSDQETRTIEADVNSPTSDDQGDNPPKQVLRSNSIEIESLRHESLQLKGLLVGEIETLEHSLSAREEETKNARATAAEYADKYVRLRQEHENQIQRLILKLSQEQHARIDVEDRLEQTLQRLWSHQGSDTTGRTSSNNIFTKIFHGGGVDHPRALNPLMNSRKERELVHEVEKQQTRISQMTAAMESTKEAQRIVLETKESVMRSLLQQNVSVSQERDALACRVEDLTSTVEQLTGLLRSMQSRSTNTLSNGHGTSIIQGGSSGRTKSLKGGTRNDD